MNTTDREEQLVELVYSVLGYEHADNITKCRHVANKILAWHEQRVAEAVENKHCEHCTMRGNLRKLSRAVEKAMNTADREEQIKVKTRSVEEIQKQINEFKKMHRKGDYPTIVLHEVIAQMRILEWVLIPDEEEEGPHCVHFYRLDRDRVRFSCVHCGHTPYVDTSPIGPAKQEPIEELVGEEVENDPSVRTLRSWKEPDLYDAVNKINELVRTVNEVRDKE